MAGSASSRPDLHAVGHETTLRTGAERAVSILVVILDTTDDRIRRLAANDIIEHFLKHRELAESEQRIAAIEQRLKRN